MRRAALPLLLTVFACGCHRGPANDTYAVYDAILPPDRPCVVRESENGGFDPVGRLYLESLALAGSLGAPSGKTQAIRDLLAQRAASPARLDPRGFGRRDVHVLSDHDLDLVQGAPPTFLDRLLRKPTDWDEFSRRWPGVDGVAVLSPVGFSRDRRNAFVCSEVDSASPDLGTCSVLARADDGTWSVAEEFPRPAW